MPSLTKLWTDGSVTGANPSDIGGGVGFLLHNPEETKWIAGGVFVKQPGYTNNMAETQAITEGVKYMRPNKPVHIVTDSQYVTYGLAKLKNNKIHKIKTNFAFWKDLNEALRRNPFTWEHVRGHNKVLGNEIVHLLAHQSALYMEDIFVSSRGSEHGHFNNLLEVYDWLKSYGKV